MALFAWYYNRKMKRAFKRNREKIADINSQIEDSLSGIRVVKSFANEVMFTDNQDPVNLIAVDMKTGEQVASMPVIDELPEGTQVSVENSAIVYDDGEGTVSTIVCNWFGAGSAKLGEADNDSSIQSYENIYDVGWLRQGNKMIAPGIERVDTVKTEDGYEMKSIWCRSDLSDTSMMIRF